MRRSGETGRSHHNRVIPCGMTFRYTKPSTGFEGRFYIGILLSGGPLTDVLEWREKILDFLSMYSFNLKLRMVDIKNGSTKISKNLLLHKKQQKYGQKLSKSIFQILKSNQKLITVQKVFIQDVQLNLGKNSKLVAFLLAMYSLPSPQLRGSLQTQQLLNHSINQQLHCIRGRRVVEASTPHHLIRNSAEPIIIIWPV